MITSQIQYYFNNKYLYTSPPFQVDMYFEGTILNFFLWDWWLRVDLKTPIKPTTIRFFLKIYISVYDIRKLKKSYHKGLFLFSRKKIKHTILNPCIYTVAQMQKLLIWE